MGGPRGVSEAVRVTLTKLKKAPGNEQIAQDSLCRP